MSGGQSAILMDAPPATCGSQSQFVKIANHLKGLGLSAPAILAWDDALGLLILEDLGAVDFAQHLASHPQDEIALYRAAFDVLEVLKKAAPPEGLITMTAKVGVEMLAPAYVWAATNKDPALQTDLNNRLQHLLRQSEAQTPVLSLRDFHAQNLIWRGEESGLAKVGLLDFQDAFEAQPMYDVASLLRDVRRDVNPGLLDLLVQKDKDRHAFHIIALQRNLRILGMLNMLAKDQGRTGYLGFLPRLWSYLDEDLKPEHTAPLRPLIHRIFKGEP